jgi:hypothetical protein
MSDPHIRGEQRTVHGVRHLPEEYSLAILPSNTYIEPNFKGEHGEISVSSSHNVIKAIVSIVQVLFAIVTLYRTRGDQLNQYGYAAFGLTVLPYIIMSIVNLLGNLVTPDFSTLYLVHSPEMDEAETRGAHFDGVTGTVVEQSEEGSDSYAFERTQEGYLLRKTSTSGVDEPVADVAQTIEDMTPRPISAVISTEEHKKPKTTVEGLEHPQTDDNTITPTNAVYRLRPTQGEEADMLLWPTLKSPPTTTIEDSVSKMSASVPPAVPSVPSATKHGERVEQTLHSSSPSTS